MNSKTVYNSEQIDKIGNTIRFMTSELGVSKTKLLKLLYLLEEVSIKKFGIPFFNISFQVWKFGPVAEPVFIETSSRPSMFKDFYDIQNSSNGQFLKGKGEFNDFEFSDNDLEVLEYVKKNYIKKSAEELIEITHRENSPWYCTAQEKGILEDLLAERITNTHHTIDLSKLISSDDTLKLDRFYDYLEIHGDPNSKELTVDC